MTRLLPPTQDLYGGPELVQLFTVMPHTQEFNLWAMIVAAGSDRLLRLIRDKTIEKENTKVVLFDILPQAVLLTGAVYYADERYRHKVICEWSDFLRLTRWRKPLAELPPVDQALIARLDLQDNGTWQLRAVDHPVRRMVK